MTGLADVLARVARHGGPWLLDPSDRRREGWPAYSSGERQYRRYLRHRSRYLAARIYHLTDEVEYEFELLSGLWIPSGREIRALTEALADPGVVA